jgi:dolichol-phosphate mannosyltransferase
MELAMRLPNAGPPEKGVFGRMQDPSVHRLGQRTLVLLCTYNELENVKAMIPSLQTALPMADLLIMDDNSPDGTGQWVQQAATSNSQLHLVSRPGKLGLGSATRDGIRWCLERDYEYLINLDADFSHRPSDCPRLLERCQQPDCDVVVASRYLPGGGFRGTAWYRRVMSQLLNRYAGRLLRLPLTDCSGSFRCYRTQALRRLQLEQLKCDGYGFLEEILVALHRQGVRYAEVPIWFDTRQSGISKLSLSDALGALRVIHNLRAQL